MTSRPNEGYAALSKFEMDAVVEEGRKGVPDERREKDQRDDSVREVIVGFKLFLMSAFDLVVVRGIPT